MYSFTASARGGTSRVSVPEIPIVPILLHYGFDEYELDDSRHGWYKVRCAFHGERNASASYSTEVQGFNCFACDTQGDAIKIVQLQEPGLEFLEAVKKACEIAGVEGPNGEQAEKSYKVTRVSADSLAGRLNGATGGKTVTRRKKWSLA